jgi:hypothetical protein
MLPGKRQPRGAKRAAGGDGEAAAGSKIARPEEEADAEDPSCVKCLKQPSAQVPWYHFSWRVTVGRVISCSELSERVGFCCRDVEEGCGRFRRAPWRPRCARPGSKVPRSGTARSEPGRAHLARAWRRLPGSGTGGVPDAPSSPGRLHPHSLAGAPKPRLPLASQSFYFKGEASKA